MKIKLLCQEIELVKIDTSAEILEPKYDGLARFSESKIYFDSDNKFPVLMHEIMHFFLFLTANGNREDYTEEQMCCIVGRMISQLLLENGDKIIQQLKEFANKNQNRIMKKVLTSNQKRSILANDE